VRAVGRNEMLELRARSETVSRLTGGDVFTLSSISGRRGKGRGEAFLLRIPLSSVLSPFVPHGERRKSLSFETVSE
jgi:hypothetical protein